MAQPPFGVVLQIEDAALEFANLAPDLDLGRDETGVLEHPEGHPQRFGHQAVVVELERFSHSWQIVEFAGVQRLEGAFFGEGVENEHRVYSWLTDFQQLDFKDQRRVGRNDVSSAPCPISQGGGIVSFRPPLTFTP